MCIGLLCAYKKTEWSSQGCFGHSYRVGVCYIKTALELNSNGYYLQCCCFLALYVQVSNHTMINCASFRAVTIKYQWCTVVQSIVILS